MEPPKPKSQSCWQGILQRATGDNDDDKGAAVPGSLSQRIIRMISISGLHDFTPSFMKTAMNQDFDLDQETSQLLNPAWQKLAIQVLCTCWVGGDERPEFIRQNQRLGRRLERAWSLFKFGVVVKNCNVVQTVRTCAAVRAFAWLPLAILIFAI